MTIQLYDYTTIRLYNYTTIQLYDYKTIWLYDYMTIQLYDYTTICPVYPAYPVFIAKSLEPVSELVSEYPVPRDTSV